MRFIKITLALLAAALLAVAVWQPLSAPVLQAESYVKVVYSNGHGSAAYIGDGYFVTAAHVVRDQPDAPLLLSDGRKVQGEVLWVNKAYDIALVRAKVGGIVAAPLRCTVPVIGDEIHASGNPGDQDRVTTWGRVAGDERSTGFWRSVVVVNMAVVPGMSGGPVYDESGAVVGITVGVMLSQAGMSASMVAVGYVVPGKTVCALLAREQDNK